MPNTVELSKRAKVAAERARELEQHFTLLADKLDNGLGVDAFVVGMIDAKIGTIKEASSSLFSHGYDECQDRHS